MNEQTWTAVDRYFERTLLGSDPALETVLERCRRAGLPDINVSPCQGQLLALLAKLSGAKRVLELGTLGGYSAIWLTRALPQDGSLLSVEVNAAYATLARENLALAGVGDRATVRCGDGQAVLQGLIAEGVAPFDLIFIDADKPSYPAYLALTRKLSRPGTVVLSDNVVRKGAIVDPQTEDPRVLGVRRYCEDLKALGWESTVIQTVGLKGYDGFTMSRVP
jgi:predicted O-methyltransferase YrrM